MSGAVGADTPFVGRGEPLRRLVDGLRTATELGVGLALVEGEPGIGKTRLLAEVAARLHWRTAWARCWEGDGTPALWPWVQVLRELHRDADGELPGGPLVSRLLAEESPATGDGAARFALFDAIAQLIAASCAETPLLVVVDDLQWADTGSVRMLRFLASDPRLRRLALLAACRPRPTTDARLDEVVVEASRQGLHLVLEGLAEEEVASIAALLRVGGGHVDVRELHVRSGGNPFFVREFARLPADTDGVPSGVAALVRMRLAALSTTARDVLHIASVFGEEFDLVDVRGLWTGDPESVTTAVDEAMVARLVDEGGARGRYQFVHAVVREVLYQGIEPAARRANHQLAARILERRPQRAVTEVAHHLLHGSDDGRANASEWAVRAAEHCFDLAAYEQSAVWYRHALETDPGSDTGRVAELLVHRGEACLAAGDVDAAGDAFRQACAVARRTGDAERFARAALGLGSGRGGFEVPTNDAGRVALLTEALDRLGPEPTATRADVLARLSIALTGAAVTNRRIELAREAVETAKVSGDAATLGRALAADCDVNAGPEHSERRQELATTVVELAATAHDRQLALLGHRLRFVARLEMGDVTGADADAARFAELADELRQPSSQWYVPLWKGTRALMLGDVATAFVCTDAAERIGARANSFNAFVLCFTQRWVTMRVEGRFDDAGLALRAATGLGPGDTPVVTGADQLRLLALVATQLGDEDRARSVLDEVMGSGLIERHRDSEWLPEMAQLAEIAVAVGHREAAGTLLDVLRPFHRRYCVEGIGAAFTGSVNWYLARLARAVGDDRAARQYDEAARRAHDRVGLVGDPPALSASVAATRAASPPPAAVDPASMIAEGATWALTFAGVTRRVRDSKGLRDLALLVTRPGTEVHCLELAGGSDVGDAAGPALDQRARTEYPQRIRDLQADIDEAHANHDLGRAERAELELDALVQQLTAAFGLSGRNRRSGSATERARTTVTSRIRAAVRQVENHHPDLGRHLRHSIRTGTWCAYVPEHPTVWRVDVAEEHPTS